MGSSLFSPASSMVQEAIEIVKARGGTVSFDPNVRKEMLKIPEMRAALEYMLQYCDVFLPSGPELMLSDRSARPKPRQSARSWISRRPASSSSVAPRVPVTTTGTGNCGLPASG